VLPSTLFFIYSTAFGGGAVFPRRKASTASRFPLRHILRNPPAKVGPSLGLILHSLHRLRRRSHVLRNPPAKAGPSLGLILHLLQEVASDFLEPCRKASTTFGGPPYDLLYKTFNNIGVTIELTIISKITDVKYSCSKSPTDNPF